MAKFLFFDDMIINILVKQEKPSGGAAVQAYGWIRGLLDAGEEINVLTDMSENKILKEECLDIILLPLYNKKKGLRWVRWLYYRLPYLYQTIKRSKPDYFYEGVPCWKSFFFAIICRHLRVKYILRISNDCFLDERAHKTRSVPHLFFQRLGMKLSYCILCQNNYQYNIIKKEFPGKKIFKISNPLLLKGGAFSNEIQSKNYIAWLGIYQYQKNIPLLFEIASLLADEKFLIAGKEHPRCDEETQYYLQKLGQLPNVQFAGFLERDQVLPFFSKAKYLLNTSHYEGFSNTFLEAMSVGTPIITTERVNPDSIISNHNLGIVFSDLPELQKMFSGVTTAVYTSMSKNVLTYIEQHDYKLLSKKLLAMLSTN
ncbi:glycosyltransferase family 4 protein [Flavitalea sp.]|nr:glycosyltransferase [Flavitalea sp.]